MMQQRLSERVVCDMRDYEGIVNMTEEEITENLLEVALYLASKEDGSNDIEIKIRNLNIHLEVWLDEEGAVEE